MKLPINWLLDHIKIKGDGGDIGNTLSNLGIEVDEVKEWKDLLGDLIIAQIKTVEPHPNANLLVVCQLCDQNNNEYQVVCGDRSIKAVDKVIYANDNSYIPSWKDRLKSKTIRGVKSQGMICSLEELGLVAPGTDDRVCILPKNTNLSISVAEALCVDLPVLDLEITPNRNDCLSIIGIARELYAKEIGTIKPMIEYDLYDKLKDQMQVDIKDTSCYMYMGRIIEGCNNNVALPHWMVSRLNSANIPRVNPIMDIVNYVSHVLGFPLQVFDLNRLTNNKIDIENLTKTEVISTIGDGSFDKRNNTWVSTSKQLPINTLVMRHGSTIINVNGAFYNTNFMCDKKTTRIYLGAGHFNRDYLAMTNRLIGFNTDNSLRLERGVDYGIMKQALALATKYIIEILDGDIGQINVSGEPLDFNIPIKLRLSLVSEMLGIKIAPALMSKYLKNLGFVVHKLNSELWEVTPPTWREDCNSDVDLVEELARIHGYEHLEKKRSLKMTTEFHDLTLTQNLIEKITQVMIARKGQEIITVPFISKSEAQAFNTNSNYRAENFKITDAKNPNQNTLRPSLLPGLLRCLNINVAHGCEEITLYETGMIFHGKGISEQIMTTGIVRYGQKHKKYWGNPTRNQDVFDIRADLDAIFEITGSKITGLRDVYNFNGIGDSNVERNEIYVPGCSGFYHVDGRVLAYFGLLNHEICDYPQLKGQEVWMAELFLNNILSLPDICRTDTSHSTYPTVRRDFCVIVDDQVRVQNLIKGIENLSLNVDISAYVFDYYISSKDQGYDQRSVTIGVDIVPRQTTLTESEIRKICDAIVQNLTSHAGVNLRK